jgi:L-rhamnose mutarotase
LAQEDEQSYNVISEIGFLSRKFSMLGKPNMETIAFRMVLNKGQRAEYERRHDEIWPDLVALLKSAGVSDYSIWLDEESNHLFGILKRPEDHGMDALPREAVMRKWWDYMADVMAVEADNTPVQVPLTRVFHMD